MEFVTQKKKIKGNERKNRHDKIYQSLDVSNNKTSYDLSTFDETGMKTGSFTIDKDILKKSVLTPLKLEKI